MSMSTRLVWDEEKRKSNLKKHRLDFAHAGDFEDASALVVEDKRGETDPKLRYRERRFIALGVMRGKLVVLVYSVEPRARRIISLRHAEPKEEKLWLGK
jgi:uncharacterized DUF497 family protein